MQKYHDEPKQYKGYLKSALGVLMGVVRRRLTTISSSHRLIPAVRGRLASLATFAVNSSAAITCTTGC